MALVSAVAGQPPLETSITRRCGNHHSNLWSDSFIQSLSSPYSASEYHERREALIEKTKDMLKELAKGEPNPTANSLLERFWTVDVVQCLGIPRHFQEEIKLVLDYTYRYWNEKRIALDLNTTALGFRTLRLNGYHVSADVFNIFKAEDGQFFCDVANKEAHSELRTMLNLLRASEIVFPGEPIMKEANTFTTKYLQHALKEWNESGLDKNQLIMEVEHAVKYPWRCNVPRWEARNYIEIFRQEKSPKVMKEGNCNENLLELAILDFNILQCQHQSELKQVSKWWNETTVKKLDFFRQRHVEYYYWAVCGLFEEEFGACRIAFAQLAEMFTLLDDIYDTYGTLDELIPFTAVLTSGDESKGANLPEYMKICSKFILELFEDIGKEADKKQGNNPEMRKYAQHCWERYVLSYFQEAEWIASNYIPTFDEYFKNGLRSSGLHVLTSYVMLLMDSIFSDKIFKELDFPSSKLQYLTPILARLIDDARDFEDEEDHGESMSFVSSYKRDNPESTYDDVVNYLNNLLYCYVAEFNKEFLESSHILPCYRNLHFNACTRGLFFIYRERDGLSVSDKDIKDAIDKTLIKPVLL